MANNGTSSKCRRLLNADMSERGTKIATQKYTCGSGWYFFLYPLMSLVIFYNSLYYRIFLWTLAGVRRCNIFGIKLRFDVINQQSR